MISIEQEKEIKILKKEVAYFMRRLYKKGLTTSFAGNISLRNNDLIFITASQTDKGRMTASEVCLLSADGKLLDENMKASMETALHLAIYHSKPGIKAIVHAHPPVATAFSIVHEPIETRITSESWAVLDEPAFAGYALMGTKELALNVSKAAQKSNVIIMKNHGILATGKSLPEAFDRVEVLENTAKSYLIGKMLGQIKTLSVSQLEAIKQIINP